MSVKTFVVGERVKMTRAASSRIQSRAIPGTVIAVSSFSGAVGQKPNRQLVTVKWDIDDKLPARFLSTNLEAIQ